MTGAVRSAHSFSWPPNTSPGLPITAGTSIPRSMSHSTTSALCSTTKRTRSSRPSPTSEKYFIASSTESSMPASFCTEVPTPMMAWPQSAVEPPVIADFSSTMTDAPASAAASAADVPAPPPPTITTSVSSSHVVGTFDSELPSPCSLRGAQPHRIAPVAMATVPAPLRNILREHLLVRPRSAMWRFVCMAVPFPLAGRALMGAAPLA